MTTQALPSGPDTEQGEFTTLAAMPAESTSTAQRQHGRTGGTEQDTDEAMTENPEPEKPRPPCILPHAPT